MIRVGLGILAVAGTVGAIALQACSSDSGGSPTPTGTGGGGNDGGGGSGGGSGALCTGVCCPTDTSCYSDPAKGASAPGAECLATRDNTHQDHIQMRQQWIRATTPAGNAAGLVYEVLAGRTQLPWKACNQTGPLGSGGYIQLVDFFLGGSDKSKHYSTVGYAKYVPPPSGMGAPSVIADGFCYGNGSFSGAVNIPMVAPDTYELGPSDMTPSTGYPPGLPAPMPLKDGTGKSTPWTVGSTKAKRLDADFDLSTDRAKLLKMFDTTDPTSIALPANGGFSGVFFYDDTTGRAHGFGPLGWVVVYSQDGSSYIAVPIREVETKSQFNDPNVPDCVGKYLADKLPAATCQQGMDPTAPGWGGGNCTATTGNAACGAGESAASTTGYFLISELEQIYSPDLTQTLCVSYPGTDMTTMKPIVDADGFYNATTKGCKTAKWNASDTTGGIPKGDWCAKNNGPATTDCHDAWQSKSFHVFAGAKIQLGSDGTPTTCGF